ncbi:MAG: hypothetical protein WKF37_14535 [Bryobacteraceae bacterium]
MTSRRPRRVTAGYAAILVLLAPGHGHRLIPCIPDGEAYDWMFRIQPPTPLPTTSIVLAIDEQTLRRLADAPAALHHRTGIKRHRIC